MDFKIELGSKVEDQLTGFSGIATARVQYVTGCNQYLVQPRCGPNGEFVDSHWFDEHRLYVDTAVQPMVLDNKKDQGPCGMAPKK